MTGTARVQIVLPAYNGGKWIGDTLQSILDQTSQDWELLVRDDGSSDNTLDLLKSWQGRLGGRLTILNAGAARNLGSSGNCLKILAATTAPYVLFTGQDDVWLPARIQRTLEAFEAAEAEMGAFKPVVVASDARVVDGDLNLIAGSFYKWSRIDPARMAKVRHVAMEGPVLGAAMAVNRAMIAFASPLPQGIYDEDSWFGLVAVAFGKIAVLRDPLIAYRRHGQNISDDPFGSSMTKILSRTLRGLAAPRWRLQKILMDGAAPQAAAFYRLYHDRLAGPDARAVKALGELPARGWLGRRLTVIRHGLWYASPVKNIGLMILL